MSFDHATLSSAIGRHIRRCRAVVMREHAIHDAVAASLAELNIAAEREHRLTPQSRLDFFLTASGTAIEVKKGNASLPVVAQIGRYFESPEVTGCILIAMRIDPSVPATFQGKPIAKLPLWKFLL